MELIKEILSTSKRVGKHIPLATMIFRFFRERQYLFRSPKQTPLGFKFTGNSEMVRGTFEQQEVQLITELLERVDVFVDIGANVGYYCCIALSRGKQTIAFEPISLNLRYLLANVRMNNWDQNIEVFPVALWDKPGIIEMFGSGTGASAIKGWAGNPMLQKRLVPSTTLDNVLADRLSGKRVMVLMDTEGSERHVLEGGQRFLALEPKPIWMVEISISEQLPKGQRIRPDLLETFNHFWQKGYRAWTAEKNSKEVTSQELKTIIETGINSLKTHNFAFLEEGATL